MVALSLEWTNHPGLKAAFPLHAVLSAVVIALSWPGALEAQARPPQLLDEGSFTILVSGQRTGREQFSVQLSNDANGRTYALRSESSLGERRTAFRLETDSAGTPVKYSLEVRQGAEPVLKLGGQRVRGRFTTLARSTDGETAREYLLRPGAVVVEEEGVVQHALLILQPLRKPDDAITHPSISPASNSQGAVRIVLESDNDSLVVAGVRRQAIRWRVVTLSSEVRLVWTDSDFRLLKLLIPSRNIEARRDDVPRL